VGQGPGHAPAVAHRVYVIVAVLAITAARLAAVSLAEIAEAGSLVALQLWFLPVYLLLVALTCRRLSWRLRRRPARDPVHRPRPARSRPAASAPPWGAAPALQSRLNPESDPRAHYLGAWVTAHAGDPAHILPPFPGMAGRGASRAPFRTFGPFLAGALA